MSMLGLQGSFLILDILSLAQDTLPFAGRNSGDIVHHVQQHFQFRFQLRHYSLQPYQKPQARQLRQPEQNIQVLPVLIYTFMELRVGISQAAIEQWGMNIHGWVIFPIPFTKFRRLVTNHQGNVFMDSKARESNTLSGFTLDVADNSDQNKDAQWIAIGA